LGSDFYRAWTGKRMPTVGLLNIGAEPGKGNRQAREAYELLMVADGIDFTGNVEGRAVAGGLVDVVVCDGFTGNILLKFTEGLGGTILTLMARETREVLAGKWWAGLVKGIVAAPLLAVRKRIDYSEYGGAPLLGLTGGFFICHGASNAKAIYNAVRRMLIMLERRLHEDQG
ncbi:phosphate--acyl-ACP acyltransferase, partial [bacterium]|nr:phosphate--acyl-ACP acyltransferase [bacterium]